MNAIGDHLWQSTLFAGILWLLTLALRKNRARVRHGLWLAASCKFLVPFSVLIALGRQIHLRKTPATIPANITIVMDQVSQPFSAPAVAVTAPSAPSPLPAILLSIWACGLIGITCAWWVRWRRIRSAVRTGTQVNLNIPIKAMSSPTLLEPGVFGIFRPVLVLPAGIFERLPAAQLQAVIAHELCHVRYRDNFIAAIHMFVETVFWFHPLVWWIGKRMVEECERACDEEVVQELGEPKAYAEGILNVCKLYVESPLSCVSGVTGANLKKRIEAIMTNRIGLKLDFAKKLALAVTGMAALAVPIAIGIINAPRIRAQSARPLAFEVASIKLDPLQGGGFRIGPPFRISGTNVAMRLITLSELVQTAYDVRDFQIAGAPAWAGDGGDYYSIQARAPGTAVPSADQVRLMLQSLLADRFQLKLHRDSKEMAVYHLIIMKNGPKLKQIPPDTPRTQLPQNTWRTPIEQLTGTLSRQLNRPMIDQTGLSGTFEYTMNWGQIDIARHADPDGFAVADLSTAIQEQLGLKLESAKEQIPILIIDHVERPSAN
jgi:bla regulator protein blaR1